jgi:soluble cytochrome b562
MKSSLTTRMLRPATLMIVLSIATLCWAKADTPLDGAMEQMKKAYKALSLGLETPQASNQDSYVSLAGTIKSSALKARDLVPELAAKLPPEEKAAMVKAYREAMDDFVVSVDALINNLKDAKWDEARKDMASLKSEMRDGHREFRKD